MGKSVELDISLEELYLQAICSFAMIAGYDVSIRESNENPCNLVIKILGTDIAVEIPKKVCMLPLALIENNVYNSVSSNDTKEGLIKFIQEIR